MIRVIQANTKRLFKKFIEFPHQLYQGDCNYIPQLNLIQRQLLLPKYNPFFKMAETVYFLAIDKNESVVGRIAAIHNKVHTEFYRDDTGFFGCFDCINNKTIASVLLKSASTWLHDKGFKHMVGPEDLSTNDKVGVLTKGYNRPPVFMMPYNYPYYKELLEHNSLTPIMTLYSYLIREDSLPRELHSKSVLLENRLKEKGIMIRPVNFNNFKKEVQKLRIVYNEANIGNWGFLPLDENSFYHMAKNLKRLVNAEHVWIAEKDSRFIGYALCVPDYNQVFKKIPNGRLLPFGWYNLITGQQKINAFRIMILGVLPAYRRLGIDWCFYAKIAEYASKQNVKCGEACYVMEQNTPMNRMLKALNSEIIKEYKLFKIDI